jgi:sialic acid synthase
MRTKLILEVGYNHQGDMDKAKELIDDASELKAWAIKFQKWDVDGFPKEIKDKKRTDNHAFGKTYYQHRKHLEFSIKQLKELKKYAEKKGLVFICSGKDLKSIKQIVEDLKCEWVKVPSQRYKDNAIFKYLYYKKPDVKIMVSTGMQYHNEIPKSRWLKEANVIMHCVSNYPTKLKDCDLGVLNTFDFYNGYSSHEVNAMGVQYAVAMGCEYIERHFTFDKNAKGTDHQVSSDVEEVKEIIKDIEFVETLLGSGKRELTDIERSNKAFYGSF